MLDGELVAMRSDGTSSFADLQAALSGNKVDDVVFYAFDLLHLDGWDLRRCRLDARKAALAALALERHDPVQRPHDRGRRAGLPPGVLDGAGRHHPEKGG